jgi:TonB family protein
MVGALMMMFGHSVALRAQPFPPSVSSLAALVAGPSFLPAADVRDANAPTMLFDIDEQLLESALEHYAAATGVSVLYNSKLTDAVRSHAVKGVYTASQALRLMLEGTGLTERRTAPGSMVLIPDPTFVAAKTSEIPAAYQRYYGRVQDGVRTRFCREKSIAQGSHRIAMRLWLDSPGTIERVDLLDSTGDTAVDRTIVATLQQLSVGAPLPQGMTQPLTMLVLPRSKDHPWGCPDEAAQPLAGTATP